MTSHIPAVSAIYAVIFGLMAALLTVRVIMNRARSGIQAGDGGDARLAQAIRAHGNFTEQVPLALLLIMLAEITGTPAGIVYTLGGALLVGRLANAWGLSGSLGPTTPRQAGAGLTVLVVVAASLALAYRLLAPH